MPPKRRRGEMGSELTIGVFLELGGDSFDF
jgi:hypothetical protein